MLLTHKAVRTVADFQGQKVRTQGGAPIQVEPFKKLGVLPVSLPLGEALPAMQNRTIDGMIAGIAPFTAFKYYDVAKPLTFLPATTLVAPIVVNRQFLTNRSGRSSRRSCARNRARPRRCSPTGT